MNASKHLIVAVEDEPFPRGPSGECCRLKLSDWLELAGEVGATRIDVCALSELQDSNPDVIEAFATRSEWLTHNTFPTRTEHDLVNRFSSYWSAVERADVPSIGVIKGTPTQFPIFVRGEQGTFAGGGKIQTLAAFKKLQHFGRPLILRPWVEILPVNSRPSVRMELRVHVVAGRAVAVEYRFPPWASQRPTPEELQAGAHWTESQRLLATECTERVARELECRWFVADFAGTVEGLRLIELNPGWCAGITCSSVARAVHLAILNHIFHMVPP